MIKTITHPDTGKAFKLGRRCPVAHCPRISIVCGNSAGFRFS